MLLSPGWRGKILVAKGDPAPVALVYRKKEAHLKTNNHNSPFDLSGRIAVVTGGARGIGCAVAKTFAGKGARIHILDIDLEHAEGVAREIREGGGQASAHECDVTKLAAVQRTVKGIANGSHVDILVNSAGIACVGNIEDTSESDLESVFRVNAMGVYNCMAACVPLMKSNGGGVILNLASIAASAGIADRFAYSASKGAVLAMTYSVAKDYLAHGIRCNCISPARVHTPFVDGFVQKNYPGREKEMMDVLARSQPVGRMAQPEEVAALALFLCSDEASFLTGTDYPLDGGFFTLRG